MGLYIKVKATLSERFAAEEPWGVFVLADKKKSHYFINSKKSTNFAADLVFL